MNDPTKYFATPPVNLIYAYDEGMRLVLEEGLETRYVSVIRHLEGVRAGLGEYGMKALAEEDVAASTLSCILYPEGVDDAAFRAALGEKRCHRCGLACSFRRKSVPHRTYGQYDGRNAYFGN